MLRKEQEKKLANHFAYFQKQIKELTLIEARKKCAAPMKHLVGNHEDCGEQWCTGKQAKIAGVPYNKLPMFDLNKETDS